MSQLNEKTRIFVLTTGGTIEKIYNESDGTLANHETIIKNKFLERLRLPYTDLDVKSVMAKDSLYMDDGDRAIILSAIKRFEVYQSPIIVLHGTDTMAVSAKFCFEKHPSITVPVIFTGAMKPLEIMDSDAQQNVVEALFAAKLVTSGYYISFHNRLFKVPLVAKNKAKGTFEAIEE
jgi:L-asparaginase